ncbi:hypothetical protein [Brevibacillus sp. MER 51]|uniref:hypothetical protein n=1 Tax=Brevibacillus sp. MER 51 TaxID=2939560 RepID=UPI00203AE37D|nr:hypothetical protein [Brevibacillus sp. MER 51]MCM3146118.1 hypothetical protein [Brevibacillus sp. MER 51]
MHLRIKHVEKALGVIFTMFIVFTIFSFISTETMLYVGNAIEYKLGIHSNIDVEKVRSFILAISSGVLGSAIVAMIFYINEYNSEKREKILKIVRENNKLQKIYREIPFLEHEGEYYKLERLYYLEYLDNKRKRKSNEAIDKFVQTVPRKMKPKIREYNKKIREIESFKHRNKLKEVLENHPEIRKRRFSEDVIEVEQKLKDILVKYDMYIDKMMESIKTLKGYDYEELKLCVEEYESVFNFSKAKKRKILKFFNPEIKEIKRIYPYALNEKVSSEIIANRIYTIHKRLVKKIDAHMQNIEDINKSGERSEALGLFLLFQNEIYGTDIKYIPKVNPEIEIQYVYNILNMCVDNLQWILFGELSNRYEYQSQEYYVRKGESVEYGSMTKIIEMEGKTAYGDIYRK